MKKVSLYLKKMVGFAVLVMCLVLSGRNKITVCAEQTGTFPDTDRDGQVLSWSYNEEEETLTISGTGEWVAGVLLNVSPFDEMKIEKVVFDKCKVLGRMSNAFCYSYSTAHKVLKEIDLSGLNTSKVTDMHGMFQNCVNLTSLDLSKFDTSNVTDMNFMFFSCNSLESLDLSSFDTSKVTNMWAMFSNCKSLKKIDLNSFNTVKVSNMGSMFSQCSNLASVDLSGFDTVNVLDMSSMFNGCTK